MTLVLIIFMQKQYHGKNRKKDARFENIPAGFSATHLPIFSVPFSPNFPDANGSVFNSISLAVDHAHWRKYFLAACILDHRLLTRPLSSGRPHLHPLHPFSSLLFCLLAVFLLFVYVCACALFGCFKL